MSVKVSFVVPAYNVSKYIACCVDSILNQSLKEIEVIVINDGSTDNTLEILKSFSDSRLKIISKQNEGLTVARNDGIALAVGEYIVNVDGDDFIDKDYAKFGYEMAKKFNADIVITDMFKDYSDRVVYIKDYVINSNKIDKNIYFDKVIFSDGVLHNMVNKVIKSEILKQTPFPKGIFLAEDFDTFVKIIAKSNNIVKLNKAFYHYRIGENNTSGFNSLKGIKDHKFVYEDVMSFCINNGKDSFKILQMLEYRKIKGVYLPVLISKANLKNEYYKKGLDIVLGDIKWIINSKGFKKLRLKYRLLFSTISYIDNYKKIEKLLLIFNKINNLFSGKKSKEFRA